MKRRFLAIFSILFILGFMTALPLTFAATNGQISFNGNVLVEGVTCETSRLQISQRWLSTTSDLVVSGQGQDFTAYVVTDGDGLAIATGVFSTPVGSNFSFTDSVNLNSINPIGHRPLTISLHDMVGNPQPIATLPGEERAAAILALSRLAISTFDPATVLTTCATLPIASPLNVVPMRNYYTTDTPTLTWNRITWATRYELQVADNLGFSGAITYPGDDTLTFIFTTPLEDNMYYWRVRACLTTNCGAWSARDSFAVDAA